MISPYSTFLALPMLIRPPRCGICAEMQRKQAWDLRILRGFGFQSRAQSRSRFADSRLVRCWMAHHQGMSLLAMANFLHDRSRATIGFTAIRACRLRNFAAGKTAAALVRRAHASKAA